MLWLYRFIKSSPGFLSMQKQQRQFRSVKLNPLWWSTALSEWEQTGEESQKGTEWGWRSGGESLNFAGMNWYLSDFTADQNNFGSADATCSVTGRMQWLLFDFIRIWKEVATCSPDAPICHHSPGNTWKCSLVDYVQLMEAARRSLLVSVVCVTCRPFMLDSVSLPLFTCIIPCLAI